MGLRGPQAGLGCGDHVIPRVAPAEAQRFLLGARRCSVHIHRLPVARRPTVLRGTTQPVGLLSRQPQPVTAARRPQGSLGSLAAIGGRRRRAAWAEAHQVNIALRCFPCSLLSGGITANGLALVRRLCECVGRRGSLFAAVTPLLLLSRLQAHGPYSRLTTKRCQSHGKPARQTGAEHGGVG